MYQGLYIYANENRISEDMFKDNPNWDEGSKAFTKDIKVRSFTPLDTATPTIAPHNGAMTYEGFYRYAVANFIRRDLVLEYFEASPFKPLPAWVQALTRGPRAFIKQPQATKDFALA